MSQRAKDRLWAWGAFAVIVVAFVAISSYLTPPNANAAPPSLSDNCEEVGNVGDLKTYFCWTDYGDYFTNSVGFTVALD